MKIKEITEIRIPDTVNKMKYLISIFNDPISPMLAKTTLAKVLNTPNLTLVLDYQEKENPEKDIRKEIMQYLDAEYPQISVDFKKYSYNNYDGMFSTLGNEQRS